MSGERVGDAGRHLGARVHHLVEPGNHRRAAGEQDVVDAVVLRRGEEELQRALHFHGQVLHERAQHLGLEVIGQAAGALGVLGLLRAHAVAADDVLGELVAAERLLARVHRLVVAQHRHVHDVGADVDDRDVLVLAAAGQRSAPRARARSAARTTRRPSPAAFRPADSATATRSSTFSLRVAAIMHFLLLGVGRRRAEHLEIEVHLLERERDVLVGLALDLDLELVLAQRGRHDDLLGDHRAASAPPWRRAWCACRGACRRASPPRPPPRGC